MYLIKFIIKSAGSDALAISFRKIYKEIKKGYIPVVDKDIEKSLKEAWDAWLKEPFVLQILSKNYQQRYLCQSVSLLEFSGTKIIRFPSHLFPNNPFAGLFENWLDRSCEEGALKADGVELFYVVAMFEGEDQIRIFRENYEQKDKRELREENVFSRTRLLVKSEDEADL